MAKKKSKLAKLKSKKTVLVASIIIIVAIALIVIFSVNRQPVSTGGKAAIVNGETITDQELNQRYDFFFLTRSNRRRKLS
jgi:hypothetical protein